MALGVRIWTAWRLRLNLLCGMLVLLVGGCSGLAVQPPDGPMPTYLVHIAFASTAERNRLAAELDVWEVDQAGRTLLARVRPDQLLGLRVMGRRMTAECRLMGEYQAALGLDDAAYGAFCPGDR